MRVVWRQSGLTQSANDQEVPSGNMAAIGDSSNSAGEIVIKPQFERVESFSEGLASFCVGGKRDADGEVTTTDGAKWGFIDDSGRIVIPPQFASVQPFSDGLAAFWGEREKHFGLVNSAGQIVRTPEFSSVGAFVQGLALARRDAGSTFIRSSGEVAFELEGRSEYGFSEGLALICNSKCGFVDGTGKPIISYEFDDAASFSEGLAAVEREDLWGYINKSGRL
jgi:WG containing repeat